MIFRKEQPVSPLSDQIAKGIDDATEALRWCRKHVQERRAIESLRLIEANLAYLSLALDWEMEGELDKAESAMERVWWQPHRDEQEYLDQTPMGH